MRDLQKVIADGYAAQPAKSWPTYDGGNLDRGKYVTSSEIGRCARRIKFEKDWAAANPGVPVPFPKWGYAERGNIIETWVVDMLALGGVVLDYAGSKQVSFYYRHQSGTPDGVEFVVRPKIKYAWLYEFKSIDPRKYTPKSPEPPHAAQLHQNMDLVSVCLDVPVAGGTILYVDASNLQLTYQFDIEIDFVEAERLEHRAASIMSAESPDDLQAEGIVTGDCDYCAFTKQCSKIVAGEIAQMQQQMKGLFNERK